MSAVASIPRGGQERADGWLARLVFWAELASTRAYSGKRGGNTNTSETAHTSASERGASRSATPGPVSSAAFEPFFREYERAVYACLWRLTGDAQTARDLTQETFIRAWQHFEQARDYERPLAWLLRIATNLAITTFQRESSRRAVSTDALSMEDMPSRSDPTRGLAERDLVQRTLLELPANQRAALVLREVYGFSCEEIGSMLGIGRDAVKMALFRGREGFRRRYLGKVDAQ
ncbi:MAG TPA: RNA polymerase sigma factor [Ktedonobacterales bacterium]